MSKTNKIILLTVLALLPVLALALFLRHHPLAVLDPSGPVGRQERGLMYTGLALSIIVVVPVYIMTVFIAWKYRESNHKAKYSPDWDHSRAIEFTWWAIPFAIIFILSLITWHSSHSLDPYRALDSDKRPLTIEVVALDWKWLFIYPKQNIASVNFVQFPQGTPVEFKVTSDSVMNSFWIPSLGGQIYAMPGMSTKLHLLADKPGIFNGSSANISGYGFAGMKFSARAASESDFDQWVEKARNSQAKLDAKVYEKLARPSQNNPIAYYSSVKQNLYDEIIMRYMVPAASQGNKQYYLVPQTHGEGM